MQKPRRTAPPAKPAPAPYTGSGTEVVDALTPDTGIPASRLLAVAAWHEHDRFGRERTERRHKQIAAKLRQVAEQQAANDNAAMQVAV
jgi:hypothetical protein